MSPDRAYRFANALVTAFIVAIVIGYGVNLIRLLNLEPNGSVFEAMMRIAGLVFPPLGVVMGYVP